MNGKERSIQTQSLMKSVIAALPIDQWEAGTREALRIHDAIVGTSPSRNVPMPTGQTGSTEPAQLGGDIVGRLVRMSRNRDSDGVWCLIQDERSEVSYKGTAWREHGKALEKIQIGQELDVFVKYVHKDGKRYTNFETPKPHTPKHAPAHVVDDISF